MHHGILRTIYIRGRSNDVTPTLSYISISISIGGGGKKNIIIIIIQYHLAPQCNTSQSMHLIQYQPIPKDVEA